MPQSDALLVAGAAQRAAQILDEMSCTTDTTAATSGAEPPGAEQTASSSGEGQMCPGARERGFAAPASHSDHALAEQLWALSDGFARDASLFATTAGACAGPYWHGC